MFDTIVVIGLGLIGTSFAEAVRQYGLAKSILGIDSDENAKSKAAQHAIVDKIISSDKAAVSKADLILLSTPVNSMKSALNSVCMHLKAGAIVTDTGSVKASLISEIGEVLPQGVHFVLGHPVLSEVYRSDNANTSNLFKNHSCILTPTPSTHPDSVERIKMLWEAIGCEVRFMTADQHDQVFAVTDQLPHLTASLLVGVADDLRRQADQEVLAVGSPRFHEYVPDYSGEPEAWAEYYLSNKSTLTDTIGRFAEELLALQRAVRTGDGELLQDYFLRTRAIQRGILRPGQNVDPPDFSRKENSPDFEQEMKLPSTPKPDKGSSSKKITRDFLVINRDQLLFSAHAVSSQVQNMRESVKRYDNQFDREIKDALEKELDSIESSSITLAKSAFRAETLAKNEVAQAQEAGVNFRTSFLKTVKLLGDHERLGDITARATFVAAGATFGAIIGLGMGSLLTGPVMPALMAGGTVGTLIGKMFVGESKPGETGEKIATTLDDGDGPSPIAES